MFGSRGTSRGSSVSQVFAVAVVEPSDVRCVATGMDEGERSNYLKNKNRRGGGGGEEEAKPCFTGGPPLLGR